MDSVPSLVHLLVRGRWTRTASSEVLGVGEMVQEVKGMQRDGLSVTSATCAEATAFNLSAGKWRQDLQQA